MLLLLLYLLPGVFGLDVFCGQLKIYEQQRFGEGSQVISSQHTDDLKQCLEVCCGILNCSGVSFTGIFKPLVGEPNCQLVGCQSNCTLNAKGDYAEGVISVVLRRTNVSTALEANSTSAPLSNTTPWGAESESPPANQTRPLAPVWAVGLAIVVAVVCVGLSLGLLSAYICYRRQKSRKQTAHISRSKAPTLHAFNPTY